MGAESHLSSGNRRKPLFSGGKGFFYNHSYRDSTQLLLTTAAIVRLAIKIILKIIFLSNQIF